MKKSISISFIRGVLFFLNLNKSMPPPQSRVKHDIFRVISMEGKVILKNVWNNNTMKIILLSQKIMKKFTIRECTG